MENAAAVDRDEQIEREAMQPPVSARVIRTIKPGWHKLALGGGPNCALKLTSQKLISNESWDFLSCQGWI